ncbi:VCBS repeat-containing protein [Devosia sp. FKR38]|uniref:FG-GAP repeat domain-containing protein n=1 Tax=Devosia sp. FKR38 TaxID=2562312 RepID=UPI0010BFC89A|nr:VCBS repeat-containing protein [Devosia sp. FKR38]
MSRMTIVQFIGGDTSDIVDAVLAGLSYSSSSGTTGGEGYIYFNNAQGLALAIRVLNYAPSGPGGMPDGNVATIYVVQNNQAVVSASLSEPILFSSMLPALQQVSAGDFTLFNQFIQSFDVDFYANSATGGVSYSAPDGNDLLVGSMYDDELTGRWGQNVYIGLAGADHFIGSTSNNALDVAYYASEGGPGGILANLAVGIIIDTFGDADTVDNIDIVVGTAQGDLFIGGDSWSEFQPGAGNDTANMGKGIDFVRYSESRASFSIDLALGRITHLATGDADHINEAEFLVFGDAVIATEEFVSFGRWAGDDLLLLNTGTGTFRYQELDGGAAVTTLGSVGAVSQVAIGNFSADFTDDVLYRTSGGWYGRIDSAGVNTNIGFRSGQTLLAVGDFNGNGRDDLLFRTDASGWYSILEGATTGVNLGYRSGQTLVGVGDFNGDGQDDMLFRSGSGWLSYVRGGNFANVNVGFRSGQDLLAIGDFDGDGKDDLLFRSTSSGWMSYAQGATGANVNLGYRTGQTLLGVGDFTDDGRSDMLFARASGWMSYLDGDSGANVNVGFAPSGTTLRSIGDYDGDGDSDLLFANGSTGAMTVFSGAVAATAIAFGNLNGQALVSADFGTNMGNDMLIA